MVPASEKDFHPPSDSSGGTEFYRPDFVAEETLDARYFTPLDRFDMRLARTMWVCDNVRAGASALELNCGTSALALLKRKHVTLAGISLSADGAARARRNGYDFAARAELTRLPFRDATFDYVINLKAREGETPDDTLADIKRVLRQGGVTLHAVEHRRSAPLRKIYSEMSAEEQQRLADLGHNAELKSEAVAERFARHFAHVEPRNVLCASSAEFLQRADEGDFPLEADFLEYLRGLAHSERRAFDMAMGYIFGEISDLGARLFEGGLHTLVRASDSPLGSSGDERRDRRALFARSSTASHESCVMADASRCLDREAEAVFDEGWYAPEWLPPVARRMRARGRIRFRARALERLRLDLTTDIPKLETRPLLLEFRLNEARLSFFALRYYGWLELELDIPPELRGGGEYELEIRANRTWRPRSTDATISDDRNLSIAVCNIEIFERVAEANSPA